MNSLFMLVLRNGNLRLESQSITMSAPSRWQFGGNFRLLYLSWRKYCYSHSD